jgi:hypothetical protein
MTCFQSDFSQGKMYGCLECTCMSAFIPKQIQTLLLKYLGGGYRPTEQILSRIAHGEQGDGYYFM